MVHGHAVDRDDAQPLGRAAEQQRQVEVGHRRRVQHAPELALAGLHLDARRRIVRIRHRHVVHRQVLGRLAEARAVVGRVAIAVDHHLRHDGLRRRRRRIGMQQVLVADHQHALRQPGRGRDRALDALHDDRARRAAQHLPRAEAVDVRVVPVHARRLVGGHAEAVLEARVAGLDRGPQHLVLVAQRRHGHAVEVQVGRQLGHLPAGARIGMAASACVRVLRAGHGHPRRGRGARCARLEFVLQAQHDEVARMHAQRRRLRAVGGDVAQACRAVAQVRVAQAQLDLQHAVDAAQVARLADQAARLGPRARILRRVRAGARGGAMRATGRRHLHRCELPRRVTGRRGAQTSAFPGTNSVPAWLTRPAAITGLREGNDASGRDSQRRPVVVAKVIGAFCSAAHADVKQCTRCKAVVPGCHGRSMLAR